MTTALHAIAFKAQTHHQHQFENLYGLLNTELLQQSWWQINKAAKPGIDGVTVDTFSRQLYENIKTLHHALKSKRYRVDDVKRVYIPKADGKMRPLGLPTLRDKLVQQGVSQILQSIWEQDFLPNSYGYRPNKSAHQAVQSLALNLQFRGYGYIVEADIKGFFNNMDHGWLMRMLKLRIKDGALLNLINQWLKARVKHPEGGYEKPASGTPQGGVISPVLANIYLHYALDLWFEKRIKPRQKGRAMLIRYADDFVVAFQYQHEAAQFYSALPNRLRKFKLDVAPDKTDLIRFSRFSLASRQRFQFLGFEFYWDKTKQGKPVVRRVTARTKHKAILSMFYNWIKENRSKRLSTILPKLKQKLMGFNNYFGLPDNSKSVSRVFYFVLHSLYKWLNRRSQRQSFNWQGFKDMLCYFQINQLRVWKRSTVIDWY